MHYSDSMSIASQICHWWFYDIFFLRAHQKVDFENAMFLHDFLEASVFVPNIKAILALS
jgi:hypothetical protein